VLFLQTAGSHFRISGPTRILKAVNLTCLPKPLKADFHLNYKKSILISQKIFRLHFKGQPIHVVREIISVKCATHKTNINTLRGKLRLCKFTECGI
jgi:hypothetical protein